MDSPPASVAPLPMSSPPLETRLKEEARRLGFELAGIAPATPADGFDRLREWLERGFAGEMGYMHRHADARRHPASVLPEVRSVLMVGMNYSAERGARSAEREESLPARSASDGGSEDPSLALRAGESSSPDSSSAPRSALRAPRSTRSGRVARYARGPDYHDVLRTKLNELLAWLQGEVPGCVGRGVVDTAPLLERDFARRAGLGWFGKNAMLINKRQGSFLFLGALLVNLDLRPDPPHESSHCGTCTACLDACPTGAFAGPGWLDARRCISYLTIELRTPVPEELRPGIGDWLFGCDVCQEVCPWNRPRADRPVAFPSRPELEALDPVELLGLSEEEFRARFRGTALFRTKRRGLLRNAALVLGNRGDPAALPTLRRALDDAEELVREAAAWAIGQIEGRTK